MAVAPQPEKEAGIPEQSSFDPSQINTRTANKRSEAPGTYPKPLRAPTTGYRPNFTKFPVNATGKLRQHEHRPAVLSAGDCLGRMLPEHQPVGSDLLQRHIIAPEHCDVSQHLARIGLNEESPTKRIVP